MQTTTRRAAAAMLLGLLGLAAAPARAQPALTDAEVRKVDREAGKLTLKHGAIQNLEMPPMTMVFRVARPQLLDGLKEGDRVRFAAEKVNGMFTVTSITPAK